MFARRNGEMISFIVLNRLCFIGVVWFRLISSLKTFFKCLERIRAFDYDFGLMSNRMNRLKLFSHLAPMGQFTVFWVHFELKSSHEFDVSKGPSNKVSWRKLHTSIKPTKSTLPINKFGFSLRFEHVCIHIKWHQKVNGSAIKTTLLM